MQRTQTQPLQTHCLGKQPSVPRKKLEALQTHSSRQELIPRIPNLAKNSGHRRRSRRRPARIPWGAHPWPSPVLSIHPRNRSHPPGVSQHLRRDPASQQRAMLQAGPPGGARAQAGWVVRDNPGDQ